MSNKIKLPEVNSSRGAPMGRMPNLPDPDDPVKFYLQEMEMVDGGYDNGGAYWGCSFDGNVMYVATDANREYWFYTRARFREQAKADILKCVPAARFFR